MERDNTEKKKRSTFKNDATKESKRKKVKKMTYRTFEEGWGRPLEDKENFEIGIKDKEEWKDKEE